MTTAMIGKLVGGSVERVEDGRILIGRGRYVDDVVLPGMLHAAFVRSPLPHARIVSVDVEAARALPGVIARLHGCGPRRPRKAARLQLPDRGPPPAGPRGARPRQGSVRGRPDRRSSSRRAVMWLRTPASWSMVDYDELPVVTTAEQALASDAPLRFRRARRQRDPSGSGGRVRLSETSRRLRGRRPGRSRQPCLSIGTDSCRWSAAAASRTSIAGRASSRTTARRSRRICCACTSPNSSTCRSTAPACSARTSAVPSDSSGRSTARTSRSQRRRSSSGYRSSGSRIGRRTSPRAGRPVKRTSRSSSQSTRTGRSSASACE